MRSLKELAREVETAQNASNLTAVLRSAHECGAALLALGLGTGAVNRHPIMAAWVSKIADLSGNYDGAYPADALRAILTAPDSDADVRKSTAAFVSRDEPGDCPGEFDSAADAFADSLKRHDERKARRDAAPDCQKRDLRTGASPDVPCQHVPKCAP